MDDEHFEHVFLSAMNTLASGLRYMMEARPLADDDGPDDDDQKPEEAKPEKVVAIGGKKQ